MHTILSLLLALILAFNASGGLADLRDVIDRRQDRLEAAGDALAPGDDAPAMAAAVPGQTVNWEDVVYEHVDPDSFYESAGALAEERDAQAVTDEYDALYAQLTHAATQAEIAYIRYGGNVTDSYWSDESVYSETVYGQMYDAFLTAVAAGIEAAQGDILGFVDADDWVDPDWFAELLHALETHGADIIEGQFVNEIFSGDTQRTMGSRRTGVTCWEGLEDLKRLAEEYMLSFRYDGVPDKPDRPLTYAKWDKLYRRDLLQKALPWYDGRLSLGEDAVLNAAAVSLAEKVVTAPTTAKYHHRILSGSVSHRSGEEELARHRGRIRGSDEGGGRL